MSRIGILIDHEFEDSEYQKPFEALKKAGHEIFHIGLEKGKKVKGKKGTTSAIIDMDIKEAKVKDFDAILIPGGHSPDYLRANESVVKFVKEFFISNKPVFTICHGPQLLISADVLEGRKITSWKSIKQDIINAGAHFEDKEVVIDGNLISSRSPADLPAFIIAVLEKLE